MNVDMAKFARKVNDTWGRGIGPYKHAIDYVSEKVSADIDIEKIRFYDDMER